MKIEEKILKIQLITDGLIEDVCGGLDNNFGYYQVKSNLNQTKTALHNRIVQLRREFRELDIMIQEYDTKDFEEDE